MYKFYLFSILLTVTSCAGAFKVNAYEGMSEDDFKRLNKGEQVVFMEGNTRTYKMFSGSSADNLYYYFQNGKLIRIDEGKTSINVNLNEN